MVTSLVRFWDLSMPKASHRRSKSYLYRTWTNMKQRCSNPALRNWKHYGGRGIAVCERWVNSFEAFAADMGERPSELHSLDRIDNDGNYEPDNCRWVTQKTQSRNTRVARLVVIGGQTYLASALAELSGHKTDAILERAARGLSYEEVVSSTTYTSNKGIRLAVAARSKKFREATHCQKGHEFTPQNTQITKEGWKRCRTCRNARAVAARARKKLSP